MKTVTTVNKLWIDWKFLIVHWNKSLLPHKLINSRLIQSLQETFKSFVLSFNPIKHKCHAIDFYDIKLISLPLFNPRFMTFIMLRNIKFMHWSDVYGVEVNSKQFISFHLVWLKCLQSFSYCCPDSWIRLVTSESQRLHIFTNSLEAKE